VSAEDDADENAADAPVSTEHDAPASAADDSSPVATEKEIAAAPSKPYSKKQARLLLAAAVLIAALITVYFLFFRNNTAPTSYTSTADQSVIYQISDFTTPATRIPGHAYISIDSTSSVQHGADYALWMYTFTLKEDGGIPFIIDRINLIYLAADGRAVEQSFSAEALEKADITTHLDPYEMVDFTGGMQYENNHMEGTAIRVFGREDGSEDVQSFVGYIPFPKT